MRTVSRALRVALRSQPLRELLRTPLPRRWVNRGKKEGRSVLAPALPLGIRLWLLPAAQQALGLLRPLSVLLLGLAEELDQFLVASLPRVFDVFVLHLSTRGGVVEDAREVKDGIAYAGGLLIGCH